MGVRANRGRGALLPANSAGAEAERCTLCDEAEKVCEAANEAAKSALSVAEKKSVTSLSRSWLPL